MKYFVIFLLIFPGMFVVGGMIGYLFAENSVPPFTVLILLILAGTLCGKAAGKIKFFDKNSV